MTPMQRKAATAHIHLWKSSFVTSRNRESLDLARARADDDDCARGRGSLFAGRLASSEPIREPGIKTSAPLLGIDLKQQQERRKGATNAAAAAAAICGSVDVARRSELGRATQ
ncbi:hypothetical protein NL676_010696 [Syzygium grande]|nr:hypothetical protein NL676_010696 [Syzygium grande]